MMISRREVLIGGVAMSVLGACAARPERAEAPIIDVFDPALGEVIDTGQTFETLGEGYQWSEGPAWDKTRQQLYFTDVPQNKAFVWKEGAGINVFLDPSGIPQEATAGFREPGANGLLIARDGRLLVCNHGRRALEALDMKTGARETLAATYHGEPFNSPNDVIQASDGTIYFTDPPYGLEGMNASPMKRQDANGVYRLSVSGEVTRLVDDMSFPNGIALSGEEDYLLISQSDPDAALIRRVGLRDTSIDHVWFDASTYMDGKPGLPDGMAVAETGHVFATGPGGVFVLTASGEALGRINLASAAANCAFGEDGRTLFITAHDRLLRLRTKVRGVGWG